MNLDFSDDQKLLREDIARFLAANAPLSAVRNLLQSPLPGYDSDLWTKLVGQGWLGAAIPECYGGLGLSPVDICIFAEELGRVLAPTPFSSCVYFFTEGLLALGTEAQKAEWLPRIVSGEVIACVAAAETIGDISTQRVSARVQGNRLSGSKMPVVDGAIALVALVLAQGDSGLGLYLAPLDNCAREPLSTIDCSRGAARLTFRDADVEPLGTPGKGAEHLDYIADRAAIYLAFEQLGGAGRCLEMARDYAKQRIAFGRPIGGYQAIKHKLADVYIGNELARSHAYYGAWALEKGGGELPVAAAAARLSATEANWQAAKENIQVHGGMGFTWEYDCHLFFRRAEHLALVNGAPRVWREKLVGALERQAREALHPSS